MLRQRRTRWRKFVQHSLCVQILSGARMTSSSCHYVWHESLLHQNQKIFLDRSANVFCTDSQWLYAVPLLGSADLQF